MSRQVAIAHAHSGTQSYVYVDLRRGAITGNVQVPLFDVNRVIGTALPIADATPPADLEDNIERLQGYAAQHLAIEDREGSWDLDFSGWRYLRHENGSYVVLHFTVGNRIAAGTRSFRVAYDAILEEDPHHDSLLIVKSSRGWGRLSLDEQQHFEMGPENRGARVSVRQRSWPQQLTASIEGFWLRAWRKTKRAFSN